MWPWSRLPSSPSAWEAEVQESYRLFQCACCGRQVCICTECDRGNIYCSGACSQTRRRESVRKAGKHYQSTLSGAANHARRQRAYTARRRAEMTHHGSSAAVGVAEPLPGEEMRASEGEPASAQEQELPHDAFFRLPDGALDAPSVNRCDFCGRAVGSWARLDFLTTPRRGRSP